MGKIALQKILESAGYVRDMEYHGPNIAYVRFDDTTKKLNAERFFLTLDQTKCFRQYTDTILTSYELVKTYPELFDKKYLNTADKEYRSEKYVLMNYTFDAEYKVRTFEVRVGYLMSSHFYIEQKEAEQKAYEYVNSEDIKNKIETQIKLICQVFPCREFAKVKQQAEDGVFYHKKQICDRGYYSQYNINKITFQSLYEVGAFEAKVDKYMNRSKSPLSQYRAEMEACKTPLSYQIWNYSLLTLACSLIGVGFYFIGLPILRICFGIVTTPLDFFLSDDLYGNSPGIIEYIFGILTVLWTAGVIIAFIRTIFNK